jgi:hypothetical protein
MDRGPRERISCRDFINKAAKPLIFFASAKTRWTTGREPTGTAERIVLVGSYKNNIYFIYLTAQLVHVHACISWCVPETQKKKKATSSHKIPCSLDCATRFCMNQLYPALFPLKTSLRPLQVFMPSFLPPMFFVSKH